ncbi:MAG: hypothetical protein IKN27_00480 [Selenomonadaceae bacterium]|nr:hypothetical protein [Selenomonadaceae bacterium]
MHKYSLKGLQNPSVKIPQRHGMKKFFGGRQIYPHFLLQMLQSALSTAAIYGLIRLKNIFGE